MDRAVAVGKLEGASLEAARLEGVRPEGARPEVGAADNSMRTS